LRAIDFAAEVVVMTHAMRRAFGCLFALLAIAAPAFGEQGSSLPAAPDGQAVPTFHSMSLYYNPDSSHTPPTGNKKMRAVAACFESVSDASRYDRLERALPDSAAHLEDNS
jgi:hypothetical protein